HFSRRISRFALHAGITRIVLDSENNWKDYNCNVVTSGRCLFEKYLTHGWYQYRKDMRLQPGDLLKFTLPKNPGFMLVG
ncbi:B3 DNA-binding domain protein, partial [Trifolium medium]|nr:B3 DNA-binding domain protein [Trifolium medium]